MAIVDADLGPLHNSVKEEKHVAVPVEEKERVDDGPQHVLAAGPVQLVVLRSVMLTGLFLLALFHTLRVARDLFLPLILAFLLSFLLSPLLRMLKRAHIPEALGAALLLVVRGGESV